MASSLKDVVPQLHGDLCKRPGKYATHSEVLTNVHSNRLLLVVRVRSRTCICLSHEFDFMLASCLVLFHTKSFYTSYDAWSFAIAAEIYDRSQCRTYLGLGGHFTLMGWFLIALAGLEVRYFLSLPLKQYHNSVRQSLDCCTGWLQSVVFRVWRLLGGTRFSR